MTSAMTLNWRRGYPRTWLAAIVALIVIVSAASAKPRDPLKLPDTQYEAATWSEIEGWADDDHNAAFATFLKSCKAILRSSAAIRDARPMHGALHATCRKAAAAKPNKPGEARGFFEQNFWPVRIAPLGQADGFLTGYYEPIVAGARNRSQAFDYPLYRKPPSLLSGGRMMLANFASRDRGGKKGGAGKRRLAAFHDRAAIDDGALAGRNLEICWLNDPIDSFFAHIQGSVRVRLEDGHLLRLNYEAANGHPYVAVGRFLIERKIVPKDEMSMDRIRQWMEANPEEGKELRRKNKSYVFFRETNLASDEEPAGAQGISLTPGRSIAVDRKLHVYGTPFFIAADLPIETEQPTTKFRRLMIAQDTGGAIIGPARADVYFGAGDEAGSVSGRLRHPGRFVMLLPIELGPAAIKGSAPLPRPKPPGLVAEVNSSRPLAKPEATKSKVKALKPAKRKTSKALPPASKLNHKRER